jgi:L-lactate dehydrogenase
LDTARLRQSIADHCGLDPRNVHAYVIGEHGDTEIVNRTNVDIAGIPIKEFCGNCEDVFLKNCLKRHEALLIVLVKRRVQHTTE